MEEVGGASPVFLHVTHTVHSDAHVNEAFGSNYTNGLARVESFVPVTCHLENPITE